MLVSPLFIFDALKNGVIGVLLTLDTLIYGLISSAFKVFMAIAGARLLSSDVYYEVANKIYIVIGVLMLFVLAYALLKGIVDPDQSLKNELGPKTIKNIVVAVIGLAITPVLFNLMYQAQGLMLENDILAKLFFRSSSAETYNINGEEVNPDEYVKSIGGAVTAVNIWQAFFYPAEDSGKTAEEIKADVSDFYAVGFNNFAIGAGVAAIAGIGAASLTVPVVGWIVGGALLVGAAIWAIVDTASNVSDFNEAFPEGEISLAQAYQIASAGEGFGVFSVFLSNYLDDGEISYYFIISTICGAFVLYAFVSFSIDMGVRAGKLAFLQIIAPIPLIMNVVPKSEKRLEKYIGVVVSTFMEVFVRIAVVYVVVFIICHLTEVFSSVGGLWGNDDLNVAEKMFALALLMLGLIAFCQSAPGFISSALGIDKGTMDGLGLKPSDFKKKLTDGGAVHARAIAGGGLRAGIKNWKAGSNLSRKDQILSALGGFGSGVARGAAYAATNKMEWGKGKEYAAKAAADAEQARIERDARTPEAQEAARKAREEQKAKLDEANKVYSAKRKEYEKALDRAKYDPDYMKSDEFKRKEDAFKLAASEREVAQRNLSEATRTVWSTSSAAGAKLADLNKKVTIAISPTIDTSFMDARAKVYSDLKSLEGLLEDTVGKDDLVQKAVAERNELEYKQSSQFAFEAYQDAMRPRMDLARKDLIISSSKDSLLKLDIDQKKLMLEAAGVTLDPSISSEDLEKTFEASIGNKINYDVVTQVCENNQEIKAAVKLSTVSESEVRVKAGVMTQQEFTESGEIRKYEEEGKQRRADAITKAEKNLKDTKKDAVARKLAEAVSGIENDTSRALSKFFADHKGQFDDHLGAELDRYIDEATGEEKVVTVGSFLRDNFGEGVTYGTVDMGKVYRGSSSDISVGLKSDDGRTTADVFKNSEGKTILRVNGKETEFDLSEPDGLHQFRDAVKKHNLTKTSSSTTDNIKVEGATAKLKDKAEKQGDVYRSDVEYEVAHRSAAVAENKDKK